MQEEEGEDEVRGKETLFPLYKGAAVRECDRRLRIPGAVVVVETKVWEEQAGWGRG